jgi:hypothetical protein
MALFDFKSIVVGPASRLMTSIRQTIDTAVHIFDVMKQIVDNIVQTYEEIKDFEIKPNWKIRVLSAPEAIDNVKELAKVPTRIFIAVRDLVTRVKDSISAFKSPAAEAEAVVAEAGSVEGFALRLFPRLASLVGKFITRILAIAGLIVQLVIDVDNAIADIKTITDGLRETVQSLNRLNVVFLKQTNPRKTVTLKDGSTMKIRVGHLHS